MTLTTLHITFDRREEPDFDTELRALIDLAQARCVVRVEAAGAWDRVLYRELYPEEEDDEDSE